MSETSRAPKLAIVIVAAAIAIGVIGRSRRQAQRRDSSRADTGFMRAMHAAFRRDLARLDDGEIERWDNFRIQLDLHHRAEDDDLWPMLRGTIDDDLLDSMVGEHAAIPPVLTAVDDAITRHQPAEAALTELRQLVLAHLENEETAVLPLIERRLTHGQWREWLLLERSKRPRGAQLDFLAWLLDGASPEDRRAVLAEFPPVGRLAYQRIVAPIYRRVTSAG
jgi:Hemerythrin HHE cation binding domain